MILLWGLLQDATLRSVYDWLRRWNAKLTFANHAAIAHSNIRLTTGPQFSYCFTCEGCIYRLEDMSAAYLRPYDARDYDDGSEKPDTMQMIPHASLVHHLMNAWADSSSATIINKPSAEATNHSKLYQAISIRASGFLVPDSIVTNDRDRIREFQSKHGSVIYKSMSSIRSVVKELRPGALDVIRNLGPVLFQQRIVGRNIRVHVIREKTAACAIQSDGIDYRYAPSSIEPVAISDDIAAKCVALTKRLGLVLSGIDLIRTPRDDWYCLEVNPNPAFSFYDVSEEKLIARAVAEALLE